MHNPNRPLRRGYTLIELLVVAMIVAIVLAILTPAIEQSRSASRRAQCNMNLCVIGLALHNYHEIFLTFPPGWISRHSMPETSYGFGWGVFLLPHVEETPLYKQIDFSQSLPPANDLLQTRVKAFRCPVDPTPDVNPLRSNYGTSNYSGNAGDAEPLWLSPRRTQFWPGEVPVASERARNGIFWMNSSTRIRDITDGTSNTLFVGERSAKSGAGIWAGVGRNDFSDDAVTLCGVGNEINKSYSSFSSYHKGGAHFVFCDGATKFVSENINPAIFRGLATRSGRENVADF